MPSRSTTTLPDAFRPTQEDPHDVALYHYTDAVGFQGIVAGKTIRLTHSAYLNDWQEVRRGEEIYRTRLRELREEYKDVQPLLEPWRDFDGEFTFRYRGTYVASFSAVPDSLAQWRAYAQDGGGYCIGWGPGALFKALDAGKPPRPFLMKCEYDETAFAALVDASIRRRLQGLRELSPSDPMIDRLRIQQSSNLVVDMMMLSPKLKHAGFSEEHEWRIISLERLALGPELFRPSRRGLVPYLEAHIDATPVDVVLGPTQHPEESEDVTERFLVAHGFAPTVAHSKTPYRP